VGVARRLSLRDTTLPGRLIHAARDSPLSAHGRERVVEGPDRFSPCGRVENEASTPTTVLDLDAEFVLEISAIPEQVDHDSTAFPMSEVIGGV
jgi:hypothetical protein